MRFKILAIISLLLCSQLSLANQRFEQRPDVKNFINLMVAKHNFNRQELNQLFKDVKLCPEIIKSMQKQYEAQPWYIYNKLFLSQTKIKDGVEFWHQHQKILAKTEKKYGVPPKVIVAIIGVESLYGKRRGKYSVLNTLATIGFNYPSRAKYYQKELAQFLLLCREQHWQPAKILGSYAGAMGQPQFMPSSYRAYGVGFNKKNNQVDLFDNLDDIISSIANYLQNHGWKHGQAIYTRAIVTGKQYQKLQQKKCSPQYTLKELATFNIKPAGHYQTWRKALFFTVDASKTKKEHWLGFTNFYVITRYNQSNLYALAISQLANKISAAYQKKYHG